jgi:hypothetical protein
LFFIERSRQKVLSKADADLGKATQALTASTQRLTQAKRCLEGVVLGGPSSKKLKSDDLTSHILAVDRANSSMIKAADKVVQLEKKSSHKLS